MTKSKLRAHLEAHYGMAVGEATLAALYEQARRRTAARVTARGRSLKTGRRVQRAIAFAR